MTVSEAGSPGKPAEYRRALGLVDNVREQTFLAHRLAACEALLVTDWNSGTLFRWSEKTGMQTLASGFKGPADFCVVPEAGGLLVVVPDLVKGELRLVRLAK